MIYYCYSIKDRVFYEEMEYAKELGNYIFYNQDNDLFLDKDENVIDIKGKTIFARSGILQYEKLIDAIIRHGGKSITNKEDFDKVLNWPKYLKTERKMILASGKDLINAREALTSIFKSDKVFFKTKQKNFSNIVKLEELLNINSSLVKTIEVHQNEDFIISEEVQIIADKYGNQEYRTFIVNGEILNISRIHNYLLEKTPEKVLEKAREVVNILNKADFPKNYILDLFVYKENENIKVDILELNPIECSGTYLYNSPFLKKYDLIHEDLLGSVPIEKIKYGDF